MNQFDAFANSWAAFLLGSPTQAGSSQFTETPTYQQTLIAGYITDTINLADTLYLELGVRYDLFTPLRTRRGVNLTFDPSGNQITRGLLEDYDWNNFAPRVGLIPACGARSVPWRLRPPLLPDTLFHVGSQSVRSGHPDGDHWSIQHCELLHPPTGSHGPGRRSAGQPASFL